MNDLLQKKWFRTLLLACLFVMGGVLLSLINSLFGFSYGDNTQFSILGHSVGTMIWGAFLVSASRWARSPKADTRR